MPFFSKERDVFLKIVKSILPYIIILVAVILIRIFIITPVSVDGNSMYPNLKNGNILLLKKFDKSYERFDIVVLNYDGNRLIKRVIGLPGEYVEYNNSKLYINGKIVEETMIDISTQNFKLESIGYNRIPDDYYFVVGDNRGVSKDSRIIGLIHKKDIIGSVSFSLWPFKSLK